MALDKFKAAPIPNPPAQYDAQYLRQVIRVIENYFSQLDSRAANNASKYTADEFVGGNFTGDSLDVDTVNALEVNTTVLNAGATPAQISSLLTNYLTAYAIYNREIISEQIMVGNVYGNYFYGNGSYLQKPYNQLVSDSNQTASAIDQAYALTYTGNDFPDGITIVSGSKIKFAQEGIYIIQFSVQFESTSTTTEYTDIWFRRNGSDIANSNSRFGIPSRKSAGIPATLIASTPYVVSVQTNDEVEVMWAVSNTAVSIKTYPAISYSAGVTPAIPATPSVFVNLQFISARFPPVTRVAPLPVVGFGQIGDISVSVR